MCDSRTELNRVCRGAHTPTSDRTCAEWKPCEALGIEYMDLGAQAWDIVDGILTHTRTIINVRDVGKTVVAI